MAANTRATQEAIAPIGRSPAERRELRIAAAGCVAAVTVALLEWAADDSDATLAARRRRGAARHGTGAVGGDAS